LGSDPDGRCHLNVELEGSSCKSQSPGRGGFRSFDLLWTSLVGELGVALSDGERWRPSAATGYKRTLQGAQPGAARRS